MAIEVPGWHENFVFRWDSIWGSLRKPIDARQPALARRLHLSFSEMARLHPLRGHTSLTDERGLTLVEVILAMGILTIALLGSSSILAIHSGIAGSLDLGQAAVSRGGYVSTATFLAQDGLEQIKRLEYTLGPPAVDGIGAGAPPAGLPDEDYGTIPGYQDFRREVTVEDGVPGPDRKLVTVTVRFRRFAPGGLTEEAVLARTIVAARP